MFEDSQHAQDNDIFDFGVGAQKEVNGLERVLLSVGYGGLEKGEKLTMVGIIEEFRAEGRRNCSSIWMARTRFTPCPIEK